MFSWIPVEFLTHGVTVGTPSLSISCKASLLVIYSLLLFAWKYLYSTIKCALSKNHRDFQVSRLLTNPVQTKLKEFHLIHFNQLEKLVIEEEALDSIKVFEINSCDNLSSILIGDSNFKSEALKKGELHITNCKKLTEIEIQSNSFLKYSIFELTSLLFFSIFT